MTSNDVTVVQDPKREIDRQRERKREIEKERGDRPIDGQ